MIRRRDALPGFLELIGQARRLFAADGTIKDDASPELHDARSRLRRRRSEVSRSLNRILDERRDFLGDAVVVLRNDRYCLPVLASARSRVPGIVHDRSGSGQTVFVEPLDVIESNNELALLAAEERREVERLLTAFGQQVLDSSADLEEAVAQMAALDALEAKVEFGEAAGGRIPELSDDGGWTLAAARHPLLDPVLAPLRSRALAESRPARPAQTVVPLDFELPARKTPARGLRPQRRRQDRGAQDRGTLFSDGASGSAASVRSRPRACPSSGRSAPRSATRRRSWRTARRSPPRWRRSPRSWTRRGPGLLALIDEIGGSTDPEEGSALAIAFLEEYLARGGRALVTTHFSALKNFAAARPDAVCAAMEFDEVTGRPNYRLHPGLSGRSRALSVAREQGLPEAVLRRAREILGEAWRRREERESEAEAAIERLRQSERELEAEREKARREAEKLAKERETHAALRARMLEEGLAGFERARTDLARRVEEEIAAIRLDASRRAEASRRETPRQSGDRDGARARRDRGARGDPRPDARARRRRPGPDPRLEDVRRGRLPRSRHGLARGLGKEDARRPRGLATGCRRRTSAGKSAGLLLLRPRNPSPSPR